MTYTAEHAAFDAAAAASCWTGEPDPSQPGDATTYAAVTAYADDYHCKCRLPHVEQVQR